MANKLNKTAPSFIDATKERVLALNKFAFETTDEVVDMGIKRAGQWQGIAEKAIKGGLKISAKQQDLVFDALESIKGQIKNGRKKASDLSK